jgi:hypothetical protein
MWSPDGKELFYHRFPDTPDHMEDVMPDGKRFLGLSPFDASRGQINVVINWTKELEERLRK